MIDKPTNQPGEDTPPRSASGLDEAQIDQADIGQLHEVFKVHQLKGDIQAKVRSLDSEWIQPGLPASQVNRAKVALLPAKPVRLRFAQLPQKTPIRRLKFPFPRFRLYRSITPALGQQIRRDRVPDNLMSREMEKRVYAKLYEQLGDGARSVEVLGVFPNIPPEAAETVQVDSELRWAVFSWGPGQKPARARPGFHLIVFRDHEKRTKKMLSRL